MILEFDMKGYDEALRQLKTVAAGIEHEKMVKLFLKSSLPMIQAARDKAPQSNKTRTFRGQQYAPGTLKKSIKAWRGKATYQATVFIGPKLSPRPAAFYANFVEYGIEKRKYGERPYMRPAIAETQQIVMAKATEAMKKEMEIVLNQLGK